MTVYWGIYALIDLNELEKLAEKVPCHFTSSGEGSLNLYV